MCLLQQPSNGGKIQDKNIAKMQSTIANENRR